MACWPINGSSASDDIEMTLGADAENAAVPLILARADGWVGRCPFDVQLNLSDCLGPDHAGPRGAYSVPGAERTVELGADAGV
jgi:hypothetical protein